MLETESGRWPKSTLQKQVVIVVNDAAWNASKDYKICMKFSFGEYTIRIYCSSGVQMKTGNKDPESGSSTNAEAKK